MLKKRNKVENQEQVKYMLTAFYQDLYRQLTAGRDRVKSQSLPFPASQQM